MDAWICSFFAFVVLAAAFLLHHGAGKIVSLCFLFVVRNSFSVSLLLTVYFCEQFHARLL